MQRDREREKAEDINGKRRVKRRNNGTTHKMLIC